MNQRHYNIAAKVIRHHFDADSCGAEYRLEKAKDNRELAFQHFRDFFRQDDPCFDILAFGKLCGAIF